MHFRSSGLLLLLCLLDVRGQKHLHDTLRALDLPLGVDEEPQLQKNHIGILIAKLLQEVHCAERIGSSQDVCSKVRPSPVLTFTPTVTQYLSPSCLFQETCLLWLECECMWRLKSLTSERHSC